jgi:hypothetical protein
LAAGGPAGLNPCYPYSPIAKVLGIIWKFDRATAVEITREAITTTRSAYRKRSLQ